MCLRLEALFICIQSLPYSIHLTERRGGQAEGKGKRDVGIDRRVTGKGVGGMQKKKTEGSEGKSLRYFRNVRIRHMFEYVNG